MSGRFITFDVGAGDCMFLKLQDGDKSFSIMVDCCSLTNEVSSYICEELGNHIDVLIITHIDNDHLVGIASLLEKKNISISKIYFNCAQQVGSNGHGDPKIDACEIQRYSEVLNCPAGAFVGKISITEAALVAQLLLKEERHNRVWEKCYISTETSIIHLEKQWGKLIFLSPTQDILREQEDVFYREYYRVCKRNIRECSSENVPVFFELISRLSEKKHKNGDVKGKISSLNGYKTVTQFEQLGETKIDSLSLSNRASLAFEWIGNKKRILVLGDADSEIVADSILQKYGDALRMYELIKVSHHGSKHSTSKRLLELVDSEHYFFTGGNKKDRPSVETISRIVSRPLSKSLKQRVLHYTMKNNSVINELQKENNLFLQADLHFSLSNENFHDFED